MLRPTDGAIFVDDDELKPLPSSFVHRIGNAVLCAVGFMFVAIQAALLAAEGARLLGYGDAVREALSSLLE